MQTSSFSSPSTTTSPVVHTVVPMLPTDKPSSSSSTEQYLKMTGYGGRSMFNKKFASTRTALPSLPISSLSSSTATSIALMDNTQILKTILEQQFWNGQQEQGQEQQEEQVKDNFQDSNHLIELDEEDIVDLEGFVDDDDDDDEDLLTPLPLANAITIIEPTPLPPTTTTSSSSSSSKTLSSSLPSCPFGNMGPQQLDTMYDTLIKLLDDDEEEHQDIFSSLDDEEIPLPTTTTAQVVSTQKMNKKRTIDNEEKKALTNKKRRTTVAAPDKVRSSSSSVSTDDISSTCSSSTSNASTASNSSSGSRFHSDQWYEKYQELVEYQKVHGHCDVPPKYKKDDQSLWRWVKRQRYQYKLKCEGKVTSSMTHERIKLLENIGITWDSQGTLWNERYNELKAYKKLKGHCNVPSKYSKNPQLSTWVKCQRRQYKLYKQGKSSNMTLDRINTLLQLDFVFEPRVGSGLK